jgi:hypothetical protein
MAKHDIDIAVPAQTIRNTDAKITIRSDGAILGRLKVSKGSVDWWPGKNSKTYYRMTWEKFDELMQTEGRERS